MIIISLKKPVLYNFFKTSLIEFSSKNLFSEISEKTKIVSLEILLFPLINMLLKFLDSEREDRKKNIIKSLKKNLNIMMLYTHVVNF